MKVHAMHPVLPLHAENETLDRWLVVLSVGILLLMLFTRAKRVNPAALTYTPSEDEIPTIILEGP